jgi:hypothetical protein
LGAGSHVVWCDGELGLYSAGFEADAGSKTTHWVLSMIKKPEDIDDEEVPALTKHLSEIMIPMTFRSCKEPEDAAKGCPGTKLSEKSVKKIKDVEKLSRSWEHLPEQVKVGRCTLSLSKSS